MIGNIKNNRQQDQFRNEIRRRQVDKLKKSKRQLLYHRHASLKMENQVYKQILQQPEAIYQHTDKYLTMLREALNSQFIEDYKNSIQKVLETLVKYYFDSRQIHEVSELFIECIACIFYSANIYSQIINQVITICIQQLDKSKNYSDQLRNRCLVALQNITATDNYSILQIVVDRSILQEIQILLTDYPVSNEDKCHILSIYGNLIDNIMFNPKKQQNYHEKIITLCYDENNDPEILEKSLQIYTHLINNSIPNIQQIITNSQQLLFMLITTDKYHKKSEQLCLSILKYFNKKQNINPLNETIIQKINQLLIAVTLNFNADYNLQALVNANKEMVYVNWRYFSEEVASLKNLCICQIVMDNWIEMEIQCSCQIEALLLSFLHQIIQDQSILAEILMEDNLGNIRRNSMNLSILEAIVEFLKNVGIQTPQKRLKFVKILNIPMLCQKISLNNQEHIMQKIEQCIYSPSQQISKYASQAMSLNQKIFNSVMI